MLMNAHEDTDRFTSGRRYDEYRDATGAWTFEIGDYLEDLNVLTPVTISPDPTPQEAYRAAVFLEGFIQKQMSEGNWSDDALDRFESFESTIEVEAVAMALREIADRTTQ